MRDGQTLTDSEVQAIVHLVGSSVPNLPSSSVTVADSNGNLLAGPGVAEGQGGSGSQTETYDQRRTGRRSRPIWPLPWARTTPTSR